MRKAKKERKTKETNIQVEWNLDGSGKSTIDTKIPFMNHMLELFAKHGLFDMTVKASGDVDVDDHHTMEDLGVVMGEAFKEAVGDKKGIKRYGNFTLPMDEALANISIDVSNRPFLQYDVKYKDQLQNFDYALVKEFFSAFINNASITVHIKLLEGDNTHHIIEAIFKGFARALDDALQYDDRVKGVPSTKGVL